MEKAKKPTVKKVLSIVGNTILWLFVAFAIVITVIVFASSNKSGDNSSLPSIGGLAFISIKSNSMDKSPYPEDYEEGGRLYGQSGFKKGALIFVNTLTDLEKKDLKVGDVITFNRDLDGDGQMEFNTHRIIEIHEDGSFLVYKTQGDHNEIPDDYDLYAGDILGKWNGKKVNGLGNVLLYLQTRAGFFIVIILPLIAFFLYELIRFIFVVLSLKGKKTEDEIRMRVMEEILRAQQQENAAPVAVDAVAPVPDAEAPAAEAEAPAPEAPAEEPTASDEEPKE